MRNVEGDQMVCPHPRVMIQFVRLSFYYNNIFIIYLFLTLFCFYKLLWSLIQKNVRTFALTFRLLTLRLHVFVSGSMLKFTLRNVAQKQVTDVSLVIKDIDTE